MSPISNGQARLVVDLDGTLVRTDMLFETFCSAFARDWRTLHRCLPAVIRGKAELKRVLAEAATVDVTTLPYDAAVLDLIHRHKDAGGRVALVSASDQKIVTAVSEHLGHFDEAFGSDGTTNLKGRQKGDFLEERYGPEGFIYVGDAGADVEVWRSAKDIVTVNASRETKSRVEALGRPVRHLDADPVSYRAYLSALRPHQWLKNLLIFVPLLVGHRFDLLTVGHSLVTYIIFCLVASGVYVINDLVDLRSDRAHPRKRLRPFASGAVPLAHALIMIPILLSIGMVLSAWMGWLVTLVVATYFLLTTAYSFVLKQRIGVDICALAILYTLRIVAGGVATGISLSVWLLAFSLFFFFALAALKRQVELADMVNRNEKKAQGRGYFVEDMTVLVPAILASGYVAVLVLALYVASDQVTRLYSQPAALWGICILLFYWITRIVILANRGTMHDDPIVFALTDRVSYVCLAGILGFAVAGALL